MPQTIRPAPRAFGIVEFYENTPALALRARYSTSDSHCVLASIRNAIYYHSAAVNARPLYSTRAPCSASYLSSRTFSALKSVHSNPPSLLWSLIPVTSFVKYYGVQPRTCHFVLTFIELRFIYPLSNGASRLGECRNKISWILLCFYKI